MIIKMAAEKVTIAPQFEIMLKVKQQGNQDFGFLNQGNKLNPFYLHLKGESVASNQPDDHSSSSANSPTNFAGLVDYSSSDEDEFEDKKVNNISKTGKQKERVDSCDLDSNGALLSHDEELEERKAKRLKQARMLNDHFARKIKEDF